MEHMQVDGRREAAVIPAGEGLGAVLFKLEGLPLGALFPEGVAAIAVSSETVAPARTLQAGGRGSGAAAFVLPDQVVAEGHVLEAVADFVTDGAAHRLAGGRVHPQGADGVVVTGAGRQPFGLVDQVDLHLVLVQDGLALAGFGELQRVDIEVVELFGLLQEVVDVHAHRGRLAVGRPGEVFAHAVGIEAVLAVFDVPEHDEMLALLAAAPGPLAIGAEHVEVEFQRLVVLVQVLHFRGLEHQDGRGLLDGELLFAAAGADPAGRAALRAVIGLGGQGDADGLAALAFQLGGGEPVLGVFRDFQGPLVVAGEDEVGGGAFVGIYREG